MSDTSGEDWLAMRLADVGKAWKEDVARLVSRIADLERAAETSRAEHAEVVAELAEETLAHELTREAVKAAVDEWNAATDALGLATARIRELEGERDELLGMLKRVPKYVREDRAVTPGATRLARLTDEIDAIVARIEKATKGTR